MTDPNHDPLVPVTGETYPPTTSYSSTDGFADSGATSGTGQSTSTKDVAKGQAADVKDSAVQSGKHVADVAKDQAADVAGQAKQQAKDLIGQTRGELQTQASQQQTKVATGLRALADELHDMAKGSQEQGLASDLARQVADRTHTVAGWLDDREPGDVLDEVRSFARQRPGAFIGIAALAGVVVGRLGRGLKDGPPETSTSSTPSQFAGTIGTTGTAGTTGGDVDLRPRDWTPSDELEYPPAGSAGVSAGTTSTQGGGLTS
ncbi:hypothetical protein [Angustibacter aerolatus]